MDEPPIIAYRKVADEALRNQLHNLEDTIKSLLELHKSMPEGDIRNKLYDRISELDSIADVQRRVLDLLI